MTEENESWEEGYQTPEEKWAKWRDGMWQRAQIIQDEDERQEVFDALGTFQGVKAQGIVQRHEMIAQKQMAFKQIETGYAKGQISSEEYKKARKELRGMK